MSDHDHDDHHDAHGHHHGLGSCGSREHSRRTFLKGATATSFALLGSAYGMPDMTFAQTAGKKTLIKVFMRGGADGLSLFPKFGDLNYYTNRPNIAVPAPSADPNSAIRLDAMYGMNPNLRPLMEIWDAGRMAIGPGVHFAEGNRSHFDCQQWIELGRREDFGDGLFYKYLQLNAGSDPLRAIRAGSSNLAASLAGADLVVPSITDGPGYNLRNNDWCGGTNCSDNGLTKALDALGTNASVGPDAERATRRTTKAMVDTIAQVQQASLNYTTSGGLQYLDGQNGRRWTSLGNGLKLVAQLLKAGVPLEVAAIDWQGHWDTHENQIGNSIIDDTNGHSRALKEGADNLLAFWRDLGPTLQNNVIVMVGSEFGRTAFQNGSRGTDHGRGSAWFAFGGPTNRGIFGPLPELTDAFVRSSPNNNSIPITMNYKDMLAEAMIRHLGIPQSQLATLFPGHTFTNFNMFTRSV
ncbi:MAG: DUF1501 domain-containing protein [Hyphomicrobiaceae bacterium]|nr:DUF1501 domain-containing protein [Hyphomicrobiaceae bacterium]